MKEKKLDKANVQAILPLTSMQEGMLYYYITNENSKRYHQQLLIAVGGEFDIACFQKASEIMTEKNEILRTVYKWKGLKQPVQIILKEYVTKFQFFDCSQMSKEEYESLLQEGAFQKQILKDQVPFYINVYKQGKEAYTMQIVYHHIMMDGWSNASMLKQLFQYYRQLKSDIEIDRLIIGRTKDYITYLKQQDKEKQEQFWSNYLLGMEAAPEPAVRKPVQICLQDEGNAEHIVQIDDELKDKIEKYASCHNVTSAAIFYAVFGILKSRYADTDDVVFGRVLAGRPSEIVHINELLGLFIHTLPVRFCYQNDRKIEDLLLELQDNLRSTDEYQHTSLVEIKKYAAIENRASLFDALVVIENYKIDKTLLEENKTGYIKSYSMTESTEYPLTINISMLTHWSVNLQYEASLFEESYIRAMGKHFLHILTQIVEKEQATVGEIELMDEEEKNRIILAGTGSEVPIPEQCTLKAVIEEQVKKSWNNILLQDKNKKMTYGEVNRKCNKMAEKLISLGAGRNKIIAVMLDRSIEMYLSIIAIIKSGSAYLPINVNNPKQRVNDIMKDSSSLVLITEDKYMNLIDKEYLIINSNDFMQLGEEDKNQEVNLTGEDLAYVIYTSGSTGMPKGVMIGHSAIYNRISWMQKEWNLSEQDNILQKTTYSFDVSVWELFWPYFSGCRLSLIEEGYEKNPDEIAKAIKLFSITVMHFVPSMLNYFLEYVGIKKVEDSLQSLKYIFASGEALIPEHYHIFGKLLGENRTKLINLYGPTEAAVDVTYFKSDRFDIESVPIGKAIDNIQIQIMDRFMRLQPVGVPGELCIAGIGLAKGYINNKKQTDDKFVTVGDNQLRVYKTGDKALLQKDGNIQYIGRKDNQVKVKGFRIELADVEVQLMSYPDIKESAVTVEENGNHDNDLVAYYVADKKLEHKELVTYLLKLLPDYMIPLQFVYVEKMPLGQSGKIDRKALRSMRNEEKAMPKSQMNQTQKRIAGIWCELLGHSAGVNDNFFHVGGDSFRILRLHTILEKEFQKEFPLQTLFEKTTIMEQAIFFEGEEEKEEQPVITDNNKEDSQLVAVIGMSGRFPKADDIDAFWRNLVDGAEGITAFTEEELLQAGIHEDVIRKGNYVKAKGIINHVDCFDEKFFGYSAKEADVMDPQLRLLHEYAWSTFEDAGYVPTEQKSPVGVYLSASGNYHWLKHLDNGDSMDLFANMILNQNDFFASRISYSLNLKGPSMSIQSACSSSLVALDRAYFDIVNDTCKMALVGGVSVTYPCVSGYEYHEGMVFSPDGHCRAFSKDSKGTVPGNGIGMVLLKRLSDAKRDGDNIYAVIRSSAVNNDGNAKVGYTAPSIEGQVAVMQKAIQAAKVPAASIDYVETHGTATELGDMVEVAALKKVYGRSGGKECRIGSLKSNIGHLDATSGIASFIKTVLVLRNGQIPKTLHFKEANSRLEIEDSGLVVNASLQDINVQQEGVFAAVSSIGIGGTNAHVILERYQGEALNDADEDRNKDKDTWNMLVLSARDKAALATMREHLGEWIEKHEDTDLKDVAFTLQEGRQEFAYRNVIVCSDVKNAITKLKEPSTRGLLAERTQSELEPEVVFVFSGIGTQYASMGNGLYEKEPYFRKIVDECSDLIQKEQGIDIRTYIKQTEVADEVLRQPSVSQPFMFVMEYSIAKLIMHWGIQPDMMIGYSFGEYVEACISGVFELEDAIRLICKRGYLMQLVSNGVMLSVPVQKEEVIKLLTPDVYLAIDNGRSCIVSGTQESMQQFEDNLRKNRCLYSRINTSNAMHSPHMEPVLKEYAQYLEGIHLHEPEIPYLSNLSGDWIKKQDALSADYWLRHMASTMNFASCMEKIEDSDNRIFIEIGPNQNTNTLLRYYVKEEKNLFTNVLRHPLESVDDQKYLLIKLGQMWTFGKKFTWNKIFSQKDRHRISLPAYPFARNIHSVDIWNRCESSNEVPVLEMRNRNVNTEHEIYYPSWERTLPTEACKEKGSDTKILLFAGSDANSELFVSRLRQECTNLTIVYEGKEFEQKKDSYMLNPDRKEDYGLLWDSLKQNNCIPNKIVHAWQIAEDTDNMKKILAKGFYSLLNIAEAIGWGTDIQMYVLASGIYEISGTETLQSEAALLTGPCYVIPLEYKNINCSLLDLDHKASLQKETVISMVIQDIMTGACKGCAGYRGRYKWIPSFNKYAQEARDSKPWSIEAGKIFLIIGGLGGVGLELAKHIAQKAKSTLILAGRMQMPSRDQWQDILEDKSDKDGRLKEKIRAIKKIEATGSKVVLYAVDIAKQEEVASLKESLDSSSIQVNYLIHAAGVADGMVIKNRKKADSEKVLEAKVYGTRYLEQYFNTGELERMVLFSSTSADIPAFGQVAYCSANAYLNTFAFANTNKNGCSIISINWDTWKEVGMAADNIKLYGDMMNASQVNHLLKDALDTETGMCLFDRCIQSGLTQPILSKLDYVLKIKQGNPNDSLLMQNDTGDDTNTKTANIRNVAAEYKPVTADVEKKIWSVIAEYLGNNDIGAEDNFLELGLKSLDMIRVSIKINELCKTSIVVTDMFQYPSIRLLGRFLSEKDDKPVQNSENRRNRILEARQNKKKRIETKGER